MNIAYLIATRKAPLRAMAAIEVARALASGQHDVRFYIGADKDDTETIDFFFKHQSKDVTLLVEERPHALGLVWNRLAAVAKNAAILMPMADDVFVTTPNWDSFLASGLSGEEPRVVAWNDIGQPGQPTYPIVTRAWYKLAGLYTSLYPFWFDDTSLNQVWSFFSGSPIQVVQNLVLTSKKSPTKSMREVGFWLSFFNSQRPARIELAAKCREALNLPPLDPFMLNLLNMRWDIHAMELSAQVSQIERAFGDQSTPSPQYLKAKAFAVSLMEKAA